MALSGLGEQLRQLQTADLIRLVQSDPELEYWFKHAAIQEAVYGSLLKSTRADLHRLVAEAIEGTLPESAGDRAAMLALHFERAGRPREALVYSVEAGDRARRTYALREALTFYDRALAMAKQVPDGDLTEHVHAAYAGRGQALQAIGDNHAALANFRQMNAAAAASGHPARQVDAINRLVPIQVLLGGLTPEVEQQLAEALRLVDEIGDQHLLARTLWNVGLAYRFSDPLRAIPYLERALALADGGAEDDEAMLELLGYILNDLAIVMWVVGRVARGHEFKSRAVDIFRRIDHRPMLADSLGGTAWMYWLMGNQEQSRRAAEEGLQISLAIENMWAAAYNYFALAAFAIDAGRLEEAIAIGELALAHARVAGFPAFIGMIQAELAAVYFIVGRAEAGQRSSAEAVEAFEAMRAPVWTSMSRAIAGRAALERGAPGEAWERVRTLTEESEERLRDMEAGMFFSADVLRVALVSGHPTEGLHYSGWLAPILEREGALGVLGPVLYYSGQMRAALGELAAAEQDLLRSRELIVLAKADNFLWQVDGALADVYAAMGDGERARRHRDQAVTLIMRLAAGVADAALRRGFLEHSDAVRVLDADTRAA